jgi:uncharacterized membrane protein
MDGGNAMRESVKNGATLLASAVAGLLVMAGATTTAAAGEGDTVRCYGVNKCKGTGDCGGKGHSCAGENSCKGQGYLNLDKETCLKIEGGRLTSEKE